LTGDYEPNKPPKTWDDFREYCINLTKDLDEDGTVDQVLIYNDTGTIIKVETDQDQDGFAERLLIYTDGNLARIERDTDKDQKMDSLEIFYLIDVRELGEHVYGYIPGAINIPGGILIFKMGNEAFWDNEMIYPPEKTDEIIAYCKKGKRSVIAADYLDRLGYENVNFLEGGWKAWEMAYPLEYEENLEMLGGSHDAEEDAGGC